MRSRRPTRLVSLGAAALVLAACGGGESGGETASELPPADVSSEAAPEAEPASGVNPAALLPTQVDLLGVEVRAESEFPENLLPPVVLDDVTTGRKVNFRNLIPQDKPVLLWMYAPH